MFDHAGARGFICATVAVALLVGLAGAHSASAPWAPARQPSTAWAAVHRDRLGVGRPAAGHVAQLPGYGERLGLRRLGEIRHPLTALATQGTTAVSELAATGTTAPRLPGWLSPVTELGGAVSRLAIDGHRVLVGIGARLVVLDISDPYRPRPVARSDPLPGLVYDVRVDRGYAYVTTSDGPRGGNAGAETRPTGRRGIEGLDSAASGDRPNGGSRPGGWLVVVDYAHVAEPTVVARVRPAALPESFSPAGLWEANERVYVASSTGLSVFEVTSPRTPRELAFVAASGPQAVAVIDDIAYIAGQCCGTVLDLTDLANPVVLGDLPRGAGATSISVAGDALWLAGLRNLVSKVDISAPRSPRWVDALDTTGRDVVANDDAVFVAGEDAVVTALPAGDGHTLRTTAVTGRPGSLGLTEAGDLVVATDAGVAVLDARSADAVSQLGFVPAAPSPVRLALSAGHAYALDPTTGLHIYDVADPERPERVAGYQVAEGQDLTVTGGYAYVAAGFGGLRMVDVHAPSLPREVGVIVPGEGVRANVAAVAVTGTLAAVPAGFPGDTLELDLFDVSDHAHPARLASAGDAFDPTFDAYDELLFRGSRLYAAGREHLAIIDVSDPTRPARLGSYFLPQGAARCNCRLGVDGDRAYFGASDGVHVVDVREPRNPVEVALWPATAVDALTESNGRLFATRLSEGALDVVDVREPDALNLESTYHLPPQSDGPADVVVDGALVYATVSNYGVQAMRLREGRPVYIPAVSR